MMRPFAVVAFMAATLAPAAADWPVFGYDAARSGFNSSERTLSKADVARLHLRWRVALGAVADSTPIFLSRVRIGAQNVPMLFQTTTAGTTYGLNATSGKILWHFATHGPNITTSTPVADTAAGVLFVPGVDGYVHALNPATGAEVQRAGFPARITLMPASEKDASSLNLANGYLYATTSGYFGDATPYVGHVVAVRLSDGSTTVFNSLCSNDKSLPTPTSCPQQRSGIWARSGAVVDPDPAMLGRVFAATGNGDFDAAAKDFGDSVLSLTRDLSKLADSFTPTDAGQLASGDIDLGSTAPAVFPRQAGSTTPLMLVQGGKDGLLRLLDRTHLGGVGGALQLVTLPAGLFSAPAVWTGPSGLPWLYIGFSSSLRSYVLATAPGGKSRITARWAANLSGSSDEGTSPVVANGVVFNATGGAIEAFDAQTGRALWSSAQSSAGGSVGPIHWQSPIVVDGWVYCSDQNGNLTAYALPG